MALRISVRVSASSLRASPAGKMVLCVDLAADWLRRLWVAGDLAVLSQPRVSSAEEEGSEVNGLSGPLEPFGGRGGLSELAGGTSLLGGGNPAPLLKLFSLSMGSDDARDFDAARDFSVFRGMLLSGSDGPSLVRPRPRDDGAGTVSSTSRPLPSYGGPGPMAAETRCISIQGLRCRVKDA